MPPDSSATPLRWEDVARGHPIGYFCTAAGQARFNREYRGRVSGLPASWSLPADLGPWPETEEAVVLRLLSLLPRLPSFLIGGFLHGSWAVRDRGDGQREIGLRVLSSMEGKGMVFASRGVHWDEWTAREPVAEAIDLNKPMVPAVRTFVNAKRFALYEESSHRRAAVRKARDLRALAELERVPESERDATWRDAIGVYRYLATQWARIA